MGLAIPVGPELRQVQRVGRCTGMVATGKLQNKKVWDLSPDEIDYVYRYRHMNPYVYAALRTYHTSALPLGRPVSLRPDTIPTHLSTFVARLLEFSPQLGHADPSYVRAGIAFYTYQLYTALDQVHLREVPEVSRLLAACAYLSIVSEKNDGFPLWPHDVIRPMTEEVTRIMAELVEPGMDFRDISMMPPYGGDIRGYEYGHVAYVKTFMRNVMVSAITCMENATNPAMIEAALLNAERAMRAYESDFGLLGGENAQVVIRCHNTVYLYGGMFFERQGRHDQAWDWYLKDIYDPAWPGLFCGTHLRTFMTTVRLLLAYRLTTGVDRKRALAERIDRSIRNAYTRTAAYARRVLKVFDAHPETDVRSIKLADDHGGELNYAGEACREPYLCSLLYEKYVRETDYQDIDYSRVFVY